MALISIESLRKDIKLWSLKLPCLTLKPSVHCVHWEGFLRTTVIEYLHLQSVLYCNLGLKVNMTY